MKKYDKYKDSGIEWIGKIPGHWNTNRLKAGINFAINGEWGEDPKGDENDIFCIRVADFNNEDLSINNTKLTLRNIPLEKDSVRKLTDGDLLVEKSGGGDNQPVGRVARFKLKIFAVSSNFISKLCVDKNKMVSDFLLYVFFSMYSKGLNTRAIKQTTGIQNLDLKIYFNEIVPFPPKEEQIIISDYLDEATKKLNKVIENKKRQIELIDDLYKLKINSVLSENKSPENKLTPSLSWTKTLSKGYSIKKLKKCLAVPLSNGLFKKKEFFGEGVLLINVFDIYPSIFIDISKIDRVRATDEEINNYCVNEKDIFLTRSSLKLEGVATCAIVNKCTEPIVFECHLIKITANSNLIEPLYLAFYLRYFANDMLVSLSNTVTMTTISQPKINNLNIILPPIDIQKDKIGEIMNIYNSKQELEKSISNQISKLEEYKKILINDVVTGKMKVTA